MNLENLNQRLLEIASQLDSNNNWHKNLNETLLISPEEVSKMQDGTPETSSGLIDDLGRVTSWLENLTNIQRANISRTEDIVRSSVSPGTLSGK